MATNDYNLVGDALWYKDAVIYEVHVRAFYDRNDDGVGDFVGLTEKLDYLQDLGVTAIWLLPFYPSPLRDDGYDIAEYKAIHPSYGTLRDFRNFLREAHRRGLRVITELVVNHTSDQHAWFQKARRAKPDSALRDFYVWSRDRNRFKEARIIFKDFESSNWAWDPVAGAYYWHRFYSHQPDLNYDNPVVQKAVLNVLDFWLEMGVDGMRLDAVPYLYEREGTNCENLAETHEFLRKLRRHVDERHANRVLLGEANQWPEDSGAYFGQGDECHMAFHFPLMPRLFMAIRTEDRFPIVDILDQTPAIPESAQWALFLRNHDELTLEMVTDEERDYMYRVYASDPQARINLGIRRRLAPLLGNQRRKIELMNGLLFSLPGTPVLYYGDEIGMGDNIYLGDRNGVRTPMQWGPDRNAGFSRANPQKLYLPVIIDPEYHYESVNVEAQQGNPHSLLWWMRRMLAFRKRSKAFGRGSFEFLHGSNPKVLSFVRRYENETILVVANLSRYVQCAQLDLSAYRGISPVEVFGQNAFPPVQEQPYFFTLGPHNFYWFSLKEQREEVRLSGAQAIPLLPGVRTLKDVLALGPKAGLEAMLPAYLLGRRWFGGKARRVRGARIEDHAFLSLNGARSLLAFVQVDYVQGDPELYLLPLEIAHGDQAAALIETAPSAVIARVGDTKTEQSILYDSLNDADFARSLLAFMVSRRSARGESGTLEGWTTRQVRRSVESAELSASPLGAEQSNSSVVFGDQFIFKLFRRLEPGQNPDLEIGRFLTERGFQNIPAVTGALEYAKGAQKITLGILQDYVANQGDAWRYTLEVLRRYFERVLTRPQGEPDAFPSAPKLGQGMDQETPGPVYELIGTYLQSASILGQRTGEMHLALASEPVHPDFAPEPYTTLAQRSLYQSLRTVTAQTLALLRSRLPQLEPGVRPEAETLLASESRILAMYRPLLERKIEAMRFRIHGDYHLGQVLYTGKDFIIIDFEGEPARPLGERRLKRSPLRDVSGMLRSFDYAAHNAVRVEREAGLFRPEESPRLESWAVFWTRWVSSIFLAAYVRTVGAAGFLPRKQEDMDLLLRSLTLEKAIYETGYELNNRPDWVSIPIRSINRLLEEAASDISIFGSEPGA